MNDTDLLLAFQEGLLDIEMVFSDGTSTPLKAIDPAHYYLTVDSLNPHVIAFAPVAGSTDPRVIAVGRGQGELLQLSLELADECHQKNDPPLATSRASVTVDFVPERAVPGGEERSVTKSHKKTAKVSGMEAGMKSVDMGDLSEILSNIALRDDNSQRRAGHFDPKNAPTNVYDQQRDFYHHSMTPLEVGMYILLGVFCIAIAIFMASCFVYASKHQHQPSFPLQQKSQSVQNAHDWVWLGRQTLDKSSVQSSSSRDVLDTNANSIRSRDSSRTYQARTTPGLPFRFEASADVNIFPNPCSEYGFNHGRERSGREIYAELPRRRQCPRSRRESEATSQQQLYQNSVVSSPRLSSRSPFLQGRQDYPSTPASPSSHPSSHPSLSQCSPLPSRATSHYPRGPPSAVNSATYTRQRPVVPSQDILPVGFPIFCQPGEQGLEQPFLDSTGFQNPWEALQLENRQGYFTEEEEEEGDDGRQGLSLDLVEDPPPGYSSLRQSPASALPPYPGPTPDLVITPEQMCQPRGEYIPLNPDINKRSPPRLGARKVFADPFNVTDSEAPPVLSEQLSPSHIFSSLEELHRELGERRASESNCETEEEREEDMSATDLSGQEDNCSSVCSVDSRELEREELQDPETSTPNTTNVSPSGSLQRKRSPVVDNNPANLDSVALGSLDYEHLMNYFESLKESSA